MTRLSRVSIAAALAAGLITGSAWAMNEAPLLEPGTSPYLSVAGVERFGLELEAPARLMIRPKIWAGTTPGTLQLRARVTDEAGRTVARGQARGDLFYLDSHLPPGHYTLVVSGRHLGGPLEPSEHYRLQTRLEF